MEDRDIAVVMVTVDRRLRGGGNYLLETLDNAQRAGMFRSPRLAGFTVVDSGGSDQWPPTDEVAEMIPSSDTAPIRIMEALRGMTYVPSLNVVRALRAGAAVDGAKWVLYLEDDLDFCADFLDGAGLWLDEHGQPAVPVYSLAANYQQVEVAYLRGLTAWQYPIDAFYGTQAFAMRREDANSLANWLAANPAGRDRAVGAYDISMHDWAHEERPQAPHFLACAPAFVQHLGEKSFIREGGDHFGFPSWQGREWSYLEHSPLLARAAGMADEQGRVRW